MLWFRPGDLHVVNVLRGLTRNDDCHGHGDFDRNGVNGYNTGRRSYIGRGWFDCGDGRGGLGYLDLRFGCAGLRGGIGSGLLPTFGGGRLRDCLGNGRFDSGDIRSWNGRALLVLRILTGGDDSACRLTPFLIPAASAASWNSRLSWRVDIVLPRLAPGNSQRSSRGVPVS